MGVDGQEGASALTPARGLLEKCLPTFSGTQTLWPVFPMLATQLQMSSTKDRGWGQGRGGVTKGSCCPVNQSVLDFFLMVPSNGSLIRGSCLQTALMTAGNV